MQEWKGHFRQQLWFNSLWYCWWRWIRYDHDYVAASPAFFLSRRNCISSTCADASITAFNSFHIYISISLLFLRFVLSERFQTIRNQPFIIYYCLYEWYACMERSAVGHIYIFFSVLSALVKCCIRSDPEFIYALLYFILIR